ncbi:hypothetical protein EF834_01805 [Rhodococcus spongiicola]|uniref:Uncharacterized protein n=2 Tax=Rhodococcus spongiicola TaxID=2487352 RepID=A0A3S3E645_9NOCA|nr:hypothetical protein EF834_01805 [Rhodococcus spongiicola]
MLVGFGGIEDWATKSEDEYKDEISGGVLGGFDKVKDAGNGFRDGQLGLNERTDLLSPLLDYGSAYMDTDRGLTQVGPCDFSNQIGPMQGCHLLFGRIVLEDQGLWDIRCQLWFDWTLVGSAAEWEIRILRPNGTVFSRMKAKLSENSATSSTNICSVVVPAADYQVQAYVTTLAVGRGILGGPDRSRLTVQHISRDTETGDTGEGDSGD